MAACDAFINDSTQSFDDKDENDSIRSTSSDCDSSDIDSFDSEDTETIMAKTFKFFITPEYSVDLPAVACRWKLYHLEHLNVVLNSRREENNLYSNVTDFLSDWDDYVLGNNVLNKQMCKELEACTENEEIVKDLTKHILQTNHIENLKGDFYYKYEEPKQNFQEITIRDYFSNQTLISIAPKADMLCFHKDYIWMVVECKKTCGDWDAQLILGMIAAATYNMNRFAVATVNIVGLKVEADRWFFYEANITRDYIKWLACQKSHNGQNFILNVEKYPYKGFFLKHAEDRHHVAGLLDHLKQKYKQQISELIPKKHGIEKYFISKVGDEETRVKISKLDPDVDV